jgi:juvenile-hormone esterase
MLVFLMLINVNLALSAVNVSSKAPVVCIADGCLRGINNGKYDAFLSIPFAKPPLGDLRFKNPEPVDPWKGILDVTLEKQICLQKNVLFPNPLIQGSEDCLYLHVYSPKTDKEQCKRKLPVLIYIYGGGFFSGAATQNISGPDYFMETKDVVMVFLSYRVHVFGFLSTGDDDMPGNFGLKDQALGIKWTVRNIAAFGGNPNRITLIAQSAGAVSANFHMMSPQTKNLFHRVILMSGTVLTPYAYINRDPLGQFILLAEKAGILNARLLTAKQIIEKLKKMKAEDIMAATDLMKIWGAIPAVLFTPVIENCEFNEAGETTSFLCGDPLKLWAKGLYSKKPILAGNTDIEGGIIALAIITNNLAVQSFNSYFGYLLGVILEMWGSSVAQNQKIIDKVVQVYMNGTSAINANNQMGYVKVTYRLFLIFFIKV